MANDVETIIPDSAIWSGPPTPGNDIFAQEPDHGEIPKCRPVAISAIDNKAGNAANTKFRVMIVEWLYPGPRRWTGVGYGWKAHSSDPIAKVPDDEVTPETHWRERPVIEAMEDCFDINPPPGTPRGRRGVRPADNLVGTHALVTCMNPNCSKRTQNYRKKAKYYDAHPVHARAGFRDADCRGVVKCAACGFFLQAAECRPVVGKWIYVLSGSKTLKLEYEIFARAEKNWDVLQAVSPTMTLKERVFDAEPPPEEWPNPNVKRWVDAGLELDAKLGSKTFHFFISPFQLGPQALQELCDSPTLCQEWHRQVQRADVSAKEPHPFKDPFAETTVKRVFGGKRPEVVAVKDPWLWAHRVCEFDYKPVLAAKLVLLTNPSEGYKHLIASTIERLKKHLDTDEWGIPKEVRESTTPNQWIRKYEACSKFLHDEASQACARLTDVLDSHAHRVVELTCQEHEDRADFMGEAYVHYHVLLSHLMGCRWGQAFMLRLAREAECQMKARIPSAHIIKKKPSEEVAAFLGDQALLQLVALFAAVIVKGQSDPDGKLWETIGRVTGHAKKAQKSMKTASQRLVDKGFVKKMVTESAKTAVAIADDNAARLTKRLGTEQQISKEMKVFKNLTNIVGYFDFIAGFAAFQPKADKPEWEKDWKDINKEYGARVAPLKGVIEYYAKLKESTFLAKNPTTGMLLKLDGTPPASLLSRSSGAALKAEAMLAEESASAKAALLTTATSLKRLVSTTGAAYALYFGGTDLIADISDAEASLTAGDYGGATGKAFMALGGVVAISLAAVQMGAAWGISAAVTMAEFGGVVGIAAAVITLAGLAIYTAYHMTRVQLFASHCFLGKRYGEGRSLLSGAPNWAQKHWAEWPGAGAKFQWHILLLLISTPAVKFEIAGKKQTSALDVHIEVEKLRVILTPANYPHLIDRYLLRVKPTRTHKYRSGALFLSKDKGNVSGLPRGKDAWGAMWGELVVVMDSSNTTVVKDAKGEIAYLVREFDWDRLLKAGGAEPYDYAHDEHFLHFTGFVWPRLTGEPTFSDVYTPINAKLQDPMKTYRREYGSEPAKSAAERHQEFLDLSAQVKEALEETR